MRCSERPHDSRAMKQAWLEVLPISQSSCFTGVGEEHCLNWKYRQRNKKCVTKPLSDDVALFVGDRKAVNVSCKICTEWASQVVMVWEVSKCATIFAPSITHRLQLAGAWVTNSEEAVYLCVSLKCRNIGRDRKPIRVAKERVRLAQMSTSFGSKRD